MLGMLVATGLATGVLTGLTGASGMSILISMLLLAGIEIRDVIGLTFLITLVNALIAAGFYWKHGHIDSRSGILIAAPAMFAVMVGHSFSNLVPANSLTLVMVICLFTIGVKFLLVPKDTQKLRSDSNPTQRPHGVSLILLGCLVGLVMGMMGGGGAVFISIALILLFQFEAKTAIGTSILIMGLAAIPGVASHWFNGTIEFSFALVILACSIPTAVAASWFANRISPRYIKQILGTYLVIISPLLLYRTYF